MEGKNIDDVEKQGVSQAFGQPVFYNGYDPAGAPGPANPYPAPNNYYLPQGAEV